MARRIITAREQHEMLLPWTRTAMPASPPENMTLHYYPTDETIPEGSQFRAPAVEARLGNSSIGHLYWDGEGHPAGYSGRKRKPGGIDFLWVDPNHRRKGVATAMYDFARQNDPRVRHAPQYEQTELGKQWSQWEKSREATTRRHEMLSPWRLASDRWFHVTPHDLPEGTVLTPGGGESPYPQGGGQDRVWVAPHLGWWNRVKDRGWHLYEVSPHQAPLDEGGAGWSTPAATVLTRHAATSEFDPFKVTHRLRDEFHDWFGQQYQQDPTRYSEKQWGAGLSHWPVIEDFLKDKYPAAHRGLMTGREDASALLDYPEASGIMSRYDDETGSDIAPYSSADHQKLGYDPAEVAAGMVLLHNQNRDGLSNGYLDEDKERLVDIFNKRQQMQRNYEQRTSRLAAVSNDVVSRLRQEFSDWYDQTGHADDNGIGGLDDRKGAQEKYGFPDPGPLAHWPNIENFLKDRYPAAHRGLEAGRERVDPLLDGGQDGHKPYQTGPGAVSEYGYDPRGVAAAFMLMHLNAHNVISDKHWPGITDKAQQRLTDIFDKRQQMQRNYEQRTGATYWHLTDSPDFRPDPNHSPELNTTMGGDVKPGLFLTRNPSHWMQGYGYWRPYVSEIEAPDDVGLGSHLSPERYVPADQYHQLQVKRTIPIDAYSREYYNEPGWVEGDSGHDFQSGLPLEPAPGGYHKRNWDGKYRYPGTVMDQTPEWRADYEQRVHDYQQRTPGIIAGLVSDEWDHPAESEGFDAWRSRLWDGVLQGKTFNPNAPGSHYRAMSDDEYQAGLNDGAFRPLIGDHLYVTDDPDRLSGGAYGANGGGHIVEFTPQPTHDIPSRTIGDRLMEKGVTHIPLDAVRRVWSWDGQDHMPVRGMAGA